MSDENDEVSTGDKTSGDDSSGAAGEVGSTASEGAPRKAVSISKSDASSTAEASDEDGADSAADSALTTPASPGSARAAARRAAARAGTSEKKGEATPKRGSATATKRPNIFARLGRFLREVVAELRKVIWPSRNQMVTYTIVVIVFVAFMVALVGVLDLLFAKGVFAVFG